MIELTLELERPLKIELTKIGGIGLDFSLAQQGPAGPKGEKGDPGEPGMPGATGLQGIPGTAGKQQVFYGASEPAFDGVPILWFETLGSGDLTLWIKDS